MKKSILTIVMCVSVISVSCDAKANSWKDWAYEGMENAKETLAEARESAKAAAEIAYDKTAELAEKVYNKGKDATEVAYDKTKKVIYVNYEILDYAVSKYNEKKNRIKEGIVFFKYCWISILMDIADVDKYSDDSYQAMLSITEKQLTHRGQAKNPAAAWVAAILRAKAS